MIALISGRLAVKDPGGTVVVDTGNVGYRIFVSLNTLIRLPEVGEELILHTVTVVRDDAMHLFGFGDTQEKDLFNLLVQVKGIGPKVALSLLGGLKPVDLKNAIYREDAGWISTVPGVGKKTAERIVLELKDKVQPAGEDPAAVDVGVEEQIISDVVSALANLGYPASQSRKAVQDILEKDGGPEDFTGIIRESLKVLSGRKA
ncbi:MAG: Holliday junction branch migration protein RuvA [bacterium]|nr:Holliday junction branch migration protein RuvA [bacterium]MDT8365998.1 Holliday junction branch migration protein RuvA [bacterium]